MSFETLTGGCLLFRGIWRMSRGYLRVSRVRLWGASGVSRGVFGGSMGEDFGYEKYLICTVYFV